MRALNTATTSKAIAKFNPNTKLSQRNQQQQASSQPEHQHQRPSDAAALAHARAHAHGPLYALNGKSTLTTPAPAPAARPRPSSRQSALSSFSSSSRQSSATHSNNNNNRNAKAAVKRLPSSDALARQTSRPTIITTEATPAATTTTTTRPPSRINSKQPTATSRSPSAASTTTATARSPRASSSSLQTARSPLDSRDQNASLTPASASSMSKNVRVTMPYDSRSPNPNGARPQLPTLSAGAARGMSRTPITPKIAAKPTQVPTLAANTHTPLPRRTQRPTTANSAASAPSRGATTPHPEDELPSFLSNITPRSGTRQSRVDSREGTPNGTPNPDRHDAWDRESRPSLGHSSVSPAPNDIDPPRRPAVTFSSIPSDLTRQPRQDEIDSKFFHASDARPSQHHPHPPPKPTLAKAPSFFYASGGPLENRANGQAPPTSAPTSHNSSQDNVSSKFIYANGTPDLRPSPPIAPSRPASIVSTSSKAPTNRPVTGAHPNGYGAAQRPLSPVKLVQQHQSGQPRSINVPPLAANRPQATATPQLGPPVGLRRTSTGTSLSAHSRNGSLTTSEAELYKAGLVPSGPSSPLASPLQPPFTLASIIQAAEDFADDESVASPDESHSEVQSPTKSTNSLDPVSELVANARRERKVQDLQITNASLEAINRTLERQLRKQTAELRRYRRLSRSGRLSMASAASSRLVSNPLSAAEGTEGLALSDLDEEDSEEEDLEDDSFTDTDSASESLSPSLMAERDAKYRKKDEKRLQLDLSKHQELLIDSQKINQSIKRCLDWTEELIKDGKKALEYSVRVSDVDIPGPRVLNPVDEEEERTQNSINFDPDATINDTSTLGEEQDDEQENEGERAVPLEPKLAGWKPDPPILDTDIRLPSDGG
ncbi:uncharacterized protein JN550_006436 [Neoarthrinium moseri]|uniref:uncharacterized protein n=1 Tax=Neoarthrinium moseri TaxID=1658444 RepID=UPI001FDD3E6F|nr:uncharacterized protein JN550_006436 [Neoarthrinium moseri]KAI1868520.1 hypothetical protein JN550_006436 [Neoarthrinium moseri]